VKPVHRSRYFVLVALSIVAVLAFSAFSQAASTLTVRETEAFLYLRQDIESEKITTLQKGETLTAIGHAVGAVSWYLVRTQGGMTGWIQASDVIPSDELREALREPPLSTWSVRTSKGRIFAGTWTVDSSLATLARAGTWTLRDQSGKILSRGAWSAQKSATGWTGTWNAVIDGQKSPYSGTWTANFTWPGDARFAALFEAAARDSIRGEWTAGSHSGSWTIRAAK
jgi:uncharacterized protein YgiM (DUF1202 family)